jgi:integrase
MHRRQKGREQKGYVFRKGNSWFLRYWDSLLADGTVVRKQRCRRLADVEPEHARLKRPPNSVLDLAEDALRPLNNAKSDPSKNVALGDFVKNVWLPHVKNRTAASTSHSYKYYWEHMLSPWCGRAWLRDFATPTAQRVLDEIARHNPTAKKATLHQLKSVLSSIFKLAIQQDYRPGPNPIRETSLPNAPEAEDTYAYNLEEVLDMLTIVPEPARTVIAVAAFTGLRRSEIQGLLWECYDGETLKVERSVWEGIAGKPKSKHSKAPVPVIGPLRTFLDAHRLRQGNPESGVMFPCTNKKKNPQRLNNLLKNRILPALNVCQTCGKIEADHTAKDHEYERNSSRPQWRGFHAFRRGLGTNLHDLGVDDKTIQAILRHANVAVTQKCYIKTLPKQSIAAMEKLETMIGAMCNERATNFAESKMIN